MKYGLTLVSTALAVTLTGCSFSASVGPKDKEKDKEETTSSTTPTVPEDELEAELVDKLEENFGQRPDSVDCPSDLEGEIGTEMRCTLTAGTDELGMTLTVTEVDGERVLYEVQVDDEIKSDEGTDPDSSDDVPKVAQSEVESQVTDALEQQIGQRPDAIDCPGDLEGTIGTEMRCMLTAGTDQVGVTLTVTEVVGTTVRFDIKVDDEVM